MTDLVRPFPPVNFLDQTKADLESGLDPVVELIPAPEVLAWVQRTFLKIGSPLYNPEHEHIADLIDAAKEGTGFLTFAWASAPAKNKNSLVLGQCERVAFRAGGWQKARQEQQMREWFGLPMLRVMWPLMRNPSWSSPSSGSLHQAAAQNVQHSPE